ncbi:MAG: GNAT family N-acetyltransferase [Actinomycetia bacterium]|nr:GNAT family N-acetyltransferase [Actinomycetes bacterium]
MTQYRWVAHDDPIMQQVLDLRFDVLMAPFGVTRDDDWDDADPASLHLVAVEDGRAVGYARLIIHGGEGQVRQVAVAFDRQRSGIGSRLMREVCAKAVDCGLDVVYLHARHTAESFYTRLGFVRVSEEAFPFGRTGMPHVRMEYRPGIGATS